LHKLHTFCALQAIVAQPLTVTGSIGVVTGKFNLAELYERVGYAKTLLSRGKFAEFLAADNRWADGVLLQCCFAGVTC
jgi:ClpP class serine protease